MIISILKFLAILSLFSFSVQELASTVTPRTLVYNFDHCSYQQYDVHDPPQKGNERALRYYHIITPLKGGDLVMYRYDLIGYAYGA